MAKSYIPPKDSDFDAWLSNLSTKITADPADYGLLAADAVIIAARYTAWHAAYLAATTIATRTPITIAAKTSERTTTEGVVRPYCQTIRNNPAVSDALKVGIEINLPNTGGTPVPPPTVAPGLTLVSIGTGNHTIEARNPETPTSKAMPPGVIGVAIYVSALTGASATFASAKLLELRTKQPMVIGTAANPRGAILTYFAQFYTRSGPQGSAQFGPVSEPLTAVVQ